MEVSRQDIYDYINKLNLNNRFTAEQLKCIDIYKQNSIANKEKIIITSEQYDDSKIYRVDQYVKEPPLTIFYKGRLEDIKDKLSDGQINQIYYMIMRDDIKYNNTLILSFPELLILSNTNKYPEDNIYVIENCIRYSRFLAAPNELFFEYLHEYENLYLLHRFIVIPSGKDIKDVVYNLSQMNFFTNPLRRVDYIAMCAQTNVEILKYMYAASAFARPKYYIANENVNISGFFRYYIDANEYNNIRMNYNNDDKLLDLYNKNKKSIEGRMQDAPGISRSGMQTCHLNTTLQLIYKIYFDCFVYILSTNIAITKELETIIHKMIVAQGDTITLAPADIKTVCPITSKGFDVIEDFANILENTKESAFLLDAEKIETICKGTNISETAAEDKIDETFRKCTQLDYKIEGIYSSFDIPTKNVENNSPGYILDTKMPESATITPTKPPIIVSYRYILGPFAIIGLGNFYGGNWTRYNGYPGFMYKNNYVCRLNNYYYKIQGIAFYDHGHYFAYINKNETNWIYYNDDIRKYRKFSNFNDEIDRLKKIGFYPRAIVVERMNFF